MKMLKVIGTFILAVGAMAFVTMDSESKALAPNDFMNKAAQGGMAEVALANLALQKSSSDSVKSLAQMILDDHAKANDELKSLAATKNVTLPTAISRSQQATEDRLRRLEGDAFDKAYVKLMVKDHEADVKMFEKESANSDDAEVKAFAAKYLPALQNHLQMARSLDGKPRNANSNGNWNSNSGNVNGNWNSNSNGNWNANATPSPTVTPDVTPTITPTPEPTVSPTLTPSPMPTINPSPSPTMSPSPTPTIKP